VNGRRDESYRRQGIEHGLARKIHRGDDVLGQDARAVYRRADAIMLLEDRHGPAASGQTTSGRQPTWAAANDRYIQHVRTII